MAASYALAMARKWTAAPSARSNGNKFFRSKTGSKIFDPCRRYCPVSIVNRNPESHFYSRHFIPEELELHFTFLRRLYMP
jgi:hypothetical protein